MASSLRRKMTALSIVCAVTMFELGIASEAATRSADHEHYALTHAGNSSSGRELFFDEKQTKCIVCHQVNGRGGEVGPDLSHIGGKFDRPHLIESLLEPSRQIVEGYRSSTIVLIDGRVETGIVRRQSQKHLTLMDAAGRTREIAMGDIQQRRESSVSLMPDGLLESLSVSEFTDLVAYLETLPAARSGEVRGRSRRCTSSS